MSLLLHHRIVCMLLLVVLGLGACSSGRVGEKISGEMVVAAERNNRVFLIKNPTTDGLLTSTYGRRRHPISGKIKIHRGIDLAAPAGTPVVAASDGTMFFRGDRGTFGNFIKIQHSDHVVTAYAHLERFEPSIAAGMQVKKGEVIGYVGTTGRSSGPHLHYEVLVDGRQIDPLGLTGTRIAEDLGDGLGKVATGFSSLVQQVGQPLQSTTVSARGLNE